MDSLICSSLEEILCGEINLEELQVRCSQYTIAEDTLEFQQIHFTFIHIQFVHLSLLGLRDRLLSSYASNLHGNLALIHTSHIWKREKSLHIDVLIESNHRKFQHECFSFIEFRWVPTKNVVEKWSVFFSQWLIIKMEIIHNLHSKFLLDVWLLICCLGRLAFISSIFVTYMLETGNCLKSNIGIKIFAIVNNSYESIIQGLPAIPTDKLSIYNY